jgi:hypothetical protein
MLHDQFIREETILFILKICPFLKRFLLILKDYFSHNMQRNSTMNGHGQTL